MKQVEDAGPAPAAYRSTRWTGQTRGGILGNWIFLHLIKAFGIRSAYALLVPVAAYYLIASPQSVRSSYGYLRRLKGPQPPWRWPILIYRHFFSLGMTLLDRYAMFMGRNDFTCTYEQEDTIVEALSRKKGVILVGAHIGNWAAGGHLLGRLDARVNLVVLSNEVKRIQALFERTFRNQAFRVLASSPDLTSSITIMNALRAGEIVAFNGDRSIEGAASVRTPFLGAPADFPVGPYLMAAVTGSPVIQIFAMREGVDRYRFFCSPPRTVGNGSRKQRNHEIAACAADFAQRLELVLSDYPFQWYNFYPFWAQTDGEAQGTES